MALIDPRRIGAVLFLLASQGAAQKPADLTAVLTQIEGQVTLSAESRAEFRSVRRAARRQIISRGEIVHVPTGAQVTLICSTEALVSLTGPRDWPLDATACGRGAPLPESSYRNLTSYAGRILPRNGALLLELETRNVDVGAGPILLSPRDTAVLEASPRLVWSRVPDAVEYEIEFRGPVGTSIRLAADGLQCGHGSGPWRGLDVCSWTPSGKWPALEPEKPVFLKFGSRQTLTAPLRQVREAYEIHLLSVGDQRNLQEALRQIATLRVDKASRLLLTAGTYARRGLYADAIANYDEALQAQEIPEARVTLGDLYLTAGLTALADREYRLVLTGAPASAAQAAAELGLGQVAYARKLFDDAGAHFERAGDLYTKLGLPAEAEEARAAAASLQVHRGNDGLPHAPAPGSLPHGFCMHSLLPAPAPMNAGASEPAYLEEKTMKRRLAWLLTLTLLGTFPLSAQRDNRGGDRGGDRGGQRFRANQGHMPPPPAPRRGGQPEAERFDGGRVNAMPHVNHNRWYGHDQPGDTRYRVAHPFDHGRFAHVGPSYRYGVSRFDQGAHRFWLGGSAFLIAPWDWPLAVDWCWDCGEDFVVYDDPDHPGWYLLYNVETGQYVHVQYGG